LTLDASSASAPLAFASAIEVGRRTFELKFLERSSAIYDVSRSGELVLHSTGPEGRLP